MATKYLVYPGHGVGVVTEPGLEKTIFGQKKLFIVMHMLESGMKIMIPKDDLKSVGVRKLMTKKTARECIKIMGTRPKINNASWSKQYRKFMNEIQTNEPVKLATVKATLESAAQTRALNFGEKKMLEHVSSVIFSELNLVITD